MIWEQSLLHFGLNWNPMLNCNQKDLEKVLIVLEKIECFIELSAKNGIRNKTKSLGASLKTKLWRFLSQYFDIHKKGLTLK